MPAEVEVMAHVSAVKPWWGLGEIITPDMTLDEMLHIAKLDNQTESKSLYVRYRQPDGTFEYTCLDDLNKDNTNYRAIIRESDGYVHNIMTEDYNIVQNRQVVEMFRQFVEAGKGTMETLGSLKHGNIIWALMKLDFQYTLPGDDKVLPYILLSNSHDGTSEFQGQDTEVCVVCMNTFRMALNGKKTRSFSYRHNGKLTPEMLEMAKKHIGLSIENAQKFAELAQRMTEVSVDTADTLRYVAGLVQPELLNVVDTAPKLLTDGSENAGNWIPRIEDFKRVGKAILLDIEHSPGQELPSRKDTVWGLFNGVTHYVDHTAGRGRDTALTSAWFGTGADLKSRALVEATKLVNR